MTHFIVVVVGDDYDYLLAPYSEGISVKPYPNTPPEEILKKFKRVEVRSFQKQQNGVPLDLFEKRTIETVVNHGKVPSWWWKEYNGSGMDENGWGLSTYNPNAKWDWYSLGGRWTGTLPLKKGKVGTLGEPGAFGNPPLREKGVDQCRIEDVDWDQLKKDAEKTAGEEWDTLFEPYDPKKCWYKEEYANAQKKLHIDMYGTREEYIRRRGYWMPYALLSEKTGWVAPGEMGWFGMSTDDTEDREEFCERFVKLMKSFPKDSIISVIDCHI